MRSALTSIAPCARDAISASSCATSSPTRFAKAGGGPPGRTTRAIVTVCFGRRCRVLPGADRRASSLAHHRSVAARMRGFFVGPMPTVSSELP